MIAGTTITHTPSRNLLLFLGEGKQNYRDRVIMYDCVSCYQLYFVLMAFGIPTSHFDFTPVIITGLRKCPDNERAASGGI